MKRILTVLFVATLVIAGIIPVIAQEEPATPSTPTPMAIPPTIDQEETARASTMVYGFRLQSDMLFYVQAGLLMHNADFVTAIGWNNSIWLAGHKYFYSNEELAAFSGIGLHVMYPKNSTMEFQPAFPIGFAVSTNTARFAVESLIFPALVGQPVEVKFAVSFFFEL